MPIVPGGITVLPTTEASARKRERNECPVGRACSSRKRPSLANTTKRCFCVSNTCSALSGATASVRGKRNSPGPGPRAHHESTSCPEAFLPRPGPCVQIGPWGTGLARGEGRAAGQGEHGSANADPVMSGSAGERTRVDDNRHDVGHRSDTFGSKAAMRVCELCAPKGSRWRLRG